ncbi:hypothetical protein KA107_03460 [Candidatus Pacearchaeota archaeon]|nr:hypothetical protein [Candidatus Pacearchaeota archaeon]
MHNDYLVSDPVHMLTPSRTLDLGLARTFMKGNTKQVKLNEEEKKAIYYFIGNRLLGGIVLCDLGRKEHPSKAKKITLEEFLKIYKN